VKDAIKVLPPVLPYLMKYHKRHVLFKDSTITYEEVVAAFDFKEDVA